MIIPPGIGKLDRQRLTAIVRGTQHTISVTEAANILAMPKQSVAKVLARLAIKGWLSRIKRGIYIPVSLSLESTTIALNQDPWIIAEKLYHPCYIGALNAAKHWGLTQQELSSITILTTQKYRKRNPVINGTHFSLRTASQQAMFGLQLVRRGGIKVYISNPSRTIIDFLMDPQLGGGIQNVKDMLVKYLRSEHKNVGLLLDYAKRLGNGAVIKRLGFLLEQCQSGEFNIIALCKLLKMTGNIKLDPKLGADKLVTRWCIWIPTGWTT
jgi:predicted transcriptional regulator of viral defense system